MKNNREIQDNYVYTINIIEQFHLIFNSKIQN